MKKFLTLLLVFSILSSSFAAVIEPVKKASEIFIPIGNTGAKISLLDLSDITVKEFEALSGSKMSFGNKISFKLAQKELRKSIKADGTLSSKKLNKFFSKPADGTSGFHIGGFALGFLIGLIGVLIAYLINDDKKSNRVKWAWLGLAAAVVLYLIIIAAA